MNNQSANLPVESENISTDLRTEDASQFVTFYFGEHFFGLPIDDVIEINRALEITPVPKARYYVSGVVNLRGQILTAINLSSRIGLKTTSSKESDKLNNVIIGHRDEPVSLLVEKIGDVIAVPKNQIEPPPDIIAGVDVKYVSQVCKLPGQLLIILNSEALQAPPTGAQKDS